MMFKQVIYYFIAVVEEGSFSKAAKKYYLSQSAISQQITKLENDLGFLLFNRKTYYPTLTKEGKRYYQLVKKLMNDYQNEYEDLKENLKKDVLTIGITGPFEKKHVPFIVRHFKEENAPEDAPAYCLDGCVHRDECPYFAPRFYLEDLEEKGGTFAKVVSLQTDKKSLLDALKDGPYGRCVYHCDNDVVDHQVVNLEFDNGVTASMTMCAFTNKCERIINLMGTKGQIRGNMEENEIIVEDFASGNTTKIKVKVPKGGHSGSDVSMMKDFVELVAGGGTAKSVSAASESIESHLMALAAEDSREHNGVVYEMKGYGK